MPHIALTRACFLTPAVTFLERTGAPARRLLATVGLPEWALRDPEGLLPTSATIRLLDHAARSEGIAGIGIRAGRARGIDVLGVFGRMVSTAPTVGDALAALVRNHRAFSSHGRVWLRPRGTDVALCHAFAGRVDERWAQAEHYLTMLAIELVRLGAGPDWRPEHVELQTGETAVACDVAARVDFGRTASAVAVPRAILAAPLRARPAVERLPLRSIEAWHASAPAEDFVGAVGQVVETLSRRGYPRIRQTASVLGASTRTLQRRLAADGVSHEALVDRVRLATAATLLAKTNARIVDVALDVGYSDHAHFTRAFRRWTGETPMRFRSAHRGPSGV